MRVLVHLRQSLSPHIGITERHDSYHCCFPPFTADDPISGSRELAVAEVSLSQAVVIPPNQELQPHDNRVLKASFFTRMSDISKVIKAEQADIKKLQAVIKALRQALSLLVITSSLILFFHSPSPTGSRVVCNW